MTAVGGVAFSVTLSNRSEKTYSIFYSLITKAHILGCKYPEKMLGVILSFVNTKF